MTPEKLVELAAAVSRGAGVSSLGEIYPREMEPVRTLKLAQNTLVGLDQITLEEIKNRVRERYPKAAALPPRPALDDVLKEAGLDFEWNPAALGGQGAYINKLREHGKALLEAMIVRHRRPPHRGFGLLDQASIKAQ